MIKRSPTLWLLPLCLLSLACSSLKPPTATVRDVRVNEVTSQGVRLDVQLDVTNPNGVPLPLGNSNYQLALAGVDVLKGSSKAGPMIGAGETAPVVMPLDVSFDSLLNVGPALLKSSGAVPYRINLEVRLGDSTLLGQAKASVDRSGTLDLRKLMDDPTFLLRSQGLRDVIDGLFR